LKGFLVQPRPEDGQGGGVLDLGARTLQRAVVVSQRIRGQHDGQLQLYRLLQVARRHDKLQMWEIFVREWREKKVLFFIVFCKIFSPSCPASGGRLRERSARLETWPS